MNRRTAFSNLLDLAARLGRPELLGFVCGEANNGIVGDDPPLSVEAEEGISDDDFAVDESI